MKIFALRVYLVSVLVSTVASMSYALEVPYKAFVIVPVADLIGQPISDAYLNSHSMSLSSYYASFPVSDCCSGSYVCPRYHQLLYNETVTVIQEVGEQVCVLVPQVFYSTLENLGDPENTSAMKLVKHDAYWTLKKYLTPYAAVGEQSTDVTTIPVPLSYAQSTSIQAIDQEIVTLALPYYDPVMRMHFSAGTRLVVIPGRDISGGDMSGNMQKKRMGGHASGGKVSGAKIEREKSDSVSHVYVHKQVGATGVMLGKIEIPSFYLIQKEDDPDKQRQQFVQVIRRWAHFKDGFIPYVWGGCSVGARCTDRDFQLIPAGQVVQAGQSSTPNLATFVKDMAGVSYFQWGTFTQSPKVGLDCSGLIVRGTQLCGIPFYYKNSKTMAYHMTPLGVHDQLQEGDIIWIPGHVMVVSDLKKNLLVEARGYTSGYGKVVEIPLWHQFKGIKTYKQLVAAYHAQQPIDRLNKQGTMVGTVINLKLLKLASVWD